MSSRTLKAKWLPLISFLLVSFSHVTSSYAAPTFDLGLAKPFTVLELGGKDLDISSSTVQGHVGKAIDDQGGQVKVSGSTITGSTFGDAGVQGVNSVQDMSAIVANVLAASSLAGGLMADQTLASINVNSGAMTLSGGGIFNVTGDFIINSGSFILDGNVGDYFVFNVYGDEFSIQDSQFQLQGAITASDILFNIIGSGSTVSLSSSTTYGTILAPGRGLNASSLTHLGALIAGSNSSDAGINISSSNIGYAPFMAMSPTPEPGTLLLLGSGVVGMGALARKRNRQK